MESEGIELFSWSLCWAGVLGAFLLDLTRWAARLKTDTLPKNLKQQLAASFMLLVAGGGTAGLFGGFVTAAWQAAAIGAGAPAVLRTLATLGPNMVERFAAADLAQKRRRTEELQRRLKEKAANSPLNRVFTDLLPMIEKLLRDAWLGSRW